MTYYNDQGQNPMTWWDDDTPIMATVERNTKDGKSATEIRKMIEDHPAFSDRFIITPRYILFVSKEEALFFQLTFTGY